MLFIKVLVQESLTRSKLVQWVLRITLLQKDSWIVSAKYSGKEQRGKSQATAMRILAIFSYIFRMKVVSEVMLSMVLCKYLMREMTNVMHSYHEQLSKMVCNILQHPFPCITASIPSANTNFKSFVFWKMKSIEKTR